MKLLPDQNISWRVVSKIEETYPDSQQVKRLGLVDASDQEIWQYARQNNYCILTFDEDFNELSLIRGIPPKIIWLRAGNLNNDQIAELLIAKEKEIKAFFKDKEIACLEIYE